jgi:hypothetical protein
MDHEKQVKDQENKDFPYYGTDAQNQESKVLPRPIILGDLTLGSPTTFLTVGANGAASALTALPVGYLVVNIGNASYQIPFYNIA